MSLEWEASYELSLGLRLQTIRWTIRALRAGLVLSEVVASFTKSAKLSKSSAAIPRCARGQEIT